MKYYVVMGYSPQSGTRGFRSGKILLTLILFSGICSLLVTYLQPTFKSPACGYRMFFNCSFKRINGNFSLSYLKSHLTELMTWITLYLPQYLSCWTHRLITITTLNLAKTSPRIYLAISSFYGLLYRNKILVSLLHLDPDPDIMIPYDLYADIVNCPVIILDIS